MDYQALYQILAKDGLDAWLQQLPTQIQHAFNADNHGDLPRWQSVIDHLPIITTSKRDLVTQVAIGSVNDLSLQDQQTLRLELQKLHPWRKGPFSLFGIDIDSEWRSDWKWDRLISHISPLQHRLVLDIGCGNGYHCWRMLGAGAKMVLGIDPGLLSVMQFQAVAKLYGTAPVFVLPLACEDLPDNLQLFDTVFSMGVLYHRRSPIDHLLELKSLLRPGGELVLETLVVAGDQNSVLLPKQRYAQMRNVWFLPSTQALELWLARCGFSNIRLVSVTKTLSSEQRTTEWMRFHSLSDFLHPDNADLTVEGLPAPTRAIIIANN